MPPNTRLSLRYRTYCTLPKLLHTFAK